MPRDSAETLPELQQADAARRPSADAIRDAVRTLIAATGDDPDREGLVDTPDRVRRAYQDWFAGYEADPTALMRVDRQPCGDAVGLVAVRNIRLASHCDHHIAPILGTIHVAYLPARYRVDGEALLRGIDAVALRMQSQEAMTVQIARALEAAIEPEGVGVVIAARHLCMTTRGVRRSEAVTVTMRMTGTFRSDPGVRREALALIGDR